MTEQEARAEARIRAEDNYPGGLSVDGILQRGYEHGFKDGAAWERARLSPHVAAPSDTDRGALIDSLRRKARIFERPEGEGANETYLLLNQAADALSQPVQVEVTEDMVKRAAMALGEFVTHGPITDLSGPNGAYWTREARFALAAALGGGDHAAE